MQNRLFYLIDDFGVSAFNPLKELAYVPILLHQTISFRYSKGSNEVLPLEIENTCLHYNLTLVDSKMSELLQHLALMTSYSKISSSTELIKKLKVENPLNFDLKYGHPFYEQKIKHFLLSLIVEISKNRLQPNLRYSSLFSIQSSGLEFCFAVYNRNAFETFLLNRISVSTKLNEIDSSNFTIDMNFQFNCNHDIALQY